MVFAETSWPDVAMALVEHVMVPVAIAIAGAVVYWTQLSKAVQAAKAAAITSGESVRASKVNTEKLSALDDKLDDNTQKTIAAAKAGATAASKVDDIQKTVNGRTEELIRTAKESAYAEGMAEGLLNAKEEQRQLAEQLHRHQERNEANVASLKKQLEEFQAKKAAESGPPPTGTPH